MIKRVVSIAAGLILVGIGGAALYGFNFSKPLTEYRQEWKFDSNELRNLSIKQNYTSSDVRFVKSTNGTNSVLIEGKAEQESIDRIRDVKLQDGSLKIDLNHKRRFLNFSFNEWKDKQKVTVALTDEASAALESLQVSIDAGSVTVDGASSRTALFSTDTGSLHITGYQGEKLTLRTDTGGIYAKDIRASLEADADTGTIQIQHLTGTAKLSTDTGSVKLQKDDTSDADIRTDTGSVSVQVPAAFGGFYDLKTDTGSVHAPESKRETKEVIKVRTDTGSIRITQE